MTNMNMHHLQKGFILCSFLCVVSMLAWISQDHELKSHKKKLTKQERIDGAIADRLFTSSDVDSGIVPYDKLFKAIKEGQKRLALAASRRKMDGSLTETIFRERGPNNVGGRTRAIHVDESDPNRNRVWIGGVSGGLWLTEDVTQQDPQWQKKGTLMENITIADIAQDPVNQDIFYVGTGESYTGTGGVGIFKSTDHGENWTLLSSTANITYINEIYVHTNGHVYVATDGNGLLRSIDGGQIWETVLGLGLAGATSNTYHDFFFNEANQNFYTSNDNTVYKSSTGNRADWTNIGTNKDGFPTNLSRVELAVCPTDPDIIYVLGGIGGAASATFVSNNGGESWISRASPDEPPYPDCTDIACGQAGYDLEIAVNPDNCAHLVVAGISLWQSPFQAISWEKPVYESQAIGAFHVDHHAVIFDAKKPGRVYYGNDGGFFMSNNYGQSITTKNLGYVTTQFYCGAIHPEVGSPYLLGGTQDNGSLQLNETGLSPAEKVNFGDGMFCFIDQDNPATQLVSSQGGNYNRSFDGGQNFEDGVSVNGGFVNRSGYDDRANILYGQTFVSDFFRWNVSSFNVEFVDIQGRNLNVSAVKADPLVPNRVYFGSAGGMVIQVDDAHSGATVQGTVYADLPGNASVSSIYMDKQSADQALISLFNYGGNLENIWMTLDGGGEWNSIEGDLPDLPVRWAVFDPTNHDRAMIATDAGVWVTDDINGDQTHWEPISADNGMPFVQVDMLLMRESDKTVMAATYGRGLMTTDVFSSPASVIVAQPIAYEGQPVLIDGSFSVNAEDYLWDLGDNTTSTDPVVNHTYQSPGSFTISLTINDSITQTKSITILPYLPAPYQQGDTDYTGDFEHHPEHCAAFSVQGTGFQRGASTKPGKDGTNSGANAWVLGINDNLYQNNTRSELYTPMYDLSEPGLYELKFYAKYAIQYRNDGFQLEYSLDGGLSWGQLGTKDNPNWYNYLNVNIADGAFPQGKSYFTNAQLNWTPYIKDISFLAGEPTVSFRYIFRSDAIEQAQGLALDDFEITKYGGELKTTITIFNAEYTGEQEVTVNWTTGIEYQCKEFVLERSYNGFGFSEVTTIPAKGVVSTFANQYSRLDQNLHDIIYYRLKVTNENTDLGYFLEFYSDTIVVLRDAEPNKVHQVNPNPFNEQIGISFSSVVDQPITVRMYDISGKLVREDISTPHSVYYQLNDLNLAQGVYVLTVQIGDGETKAYNLLTLDQHK